MARESATCVHVHDMHMHMHIRAPVRLNVKTASGKVRACSPLAKLRLVARTFHVTLLIIGEFLLVHSPAHAVAPFSP